MKLYSNGLGNPFALTALVTADLVDVKVEVAYKTTAEWQADADMKAKNLTMRFPLLELDGGELVWESSAIAAHLARCVPDSGLFGQSAFETGLVEQWICYTQSTLYPAGGPVAYAVLGHKVVAKEVYAEDLKTLKAHLKVLDSYLADKPFLVGENLTVADVVVALALLIPMQLVLDPAARSGMPHLTEWFEKCVGLPSFVRRLGYTKLCQVAMGPFDPAAAPAEPVAAAKPAAAKAADDDDDLDLFGDDDEEDAARAKKIAEEQKAKAKPKKKLVEKSLIILDVKPLDDTVDLDALAARILENIQ
jgi:elongation factor 1-gamma